MSHPRHSSRRGAVLIIVLGVLVVLCLLGTTFAQVSTLNRTIARGYLDGIRAQLVARAGVESAVARLKCGVEQGFERDRSWVYHGGDLTESLPCPPEVPLEQATSVSYALEAEDPQDPLDASIAPRLVSVEGRKVGLSGVLGGTYAARGDVYSLRVRDASGLICVNDGVEEGPGGSVSLNLVRILNALGAQPSVRIPDLGAKLVGRRPPEGYASKAALLEAFGGDRGAFDRVREFVTVHSWKDRDVANPVPLSRETLHLYPVPYARHGIYRYGRNPDVDGNPITQPLLFAPEATDPRGTAHAFYGMDELNPQWVELVARSPVNVNSAPREVLIALLTDLKGFFWVERRRQSPNLTQNYSYLKVAHSYSPEGVEGDETGFLYSTYPIAGDGGTTTSGISAAAIADEILACRGRIASPWHDYSKPGPFGGPFRSWREFNAFCDNLVEAGLLRDPRDIYYDHQCGGLAKPNGHGDGPLVAAHERLQRRTASQAIADVLKANFNPNLHLNELNPDAGLFLLVDKTDLIVNSTEFSLLPTGCFEIESLGRILAPADRTGDALLAKDNEIVAQSTLHASVRLFDQVRETNQRQFSHGSLSKREGRVRTNNGCALEIGPEPATGLGPRENEYSGYLALPTTSAVELADPESTGRVLTTPAGTGPRSTVYVPLAVDFDAAMHASGETRELASRKTGFEEVSNVPDRTEGNVSGPYGPASGAGNRHRLCRSARPGRGTGSVDEIAPSDLRVDGAYLERHAGLAYANDPSIWGGVITESEGVVSYWIKPSYDPATTGKSRTYFNTNRYHPPTSKNINPSPFAHFFLPAHDAPPGKSSNSEIATPAYEYHLGSTVLRPVCFAFGWGFGNNTGYGTTSQGGTMTPPLSHRAHADSEKPELLQARRWVHVVLRWRVMPAFGGQIANIAELYLDGEQLPGSTRIWYPASQENSQRPSDVDWTKHGDGRQSMNALRIGSTSRFCDKLVHDRNWPADATIDEFHLWKRQSSLGEALELWNQGRYARPSGAASFTSGPLLPPERNVRTLPPARGTASGTRGDAPIPSPEAAKIPNRILGVSWSWSAERVGERFRPALGDRLTDGLVHPEVTLSLLDGGKVAAVCRDDGFSQVAETVALGPSTRYRIDVSIPDSTDSTILTATPFIDDVTVLFDCEETYLDYWRLP